MRSKEHSSTMTTLEKVIGDAAGGVLAAYVGNVVFAPQGKWRFATLAASATAGAALTAYAQEQVETKKDDLSWALSNPVTFGALVAAYGSTYNVLLDLLLPEELLLVGPRITALTAFALGGYTAYVSGPTVGTLAQLTVYLTLKMFSQPAPVPTIVKDSPGASHIPSILWEGVKDEYFKVAAPLFDNLKHDLEHSVQHGTLYPGYLLLGMWDLVSFAPQFVADSVGEWLWHFVRVFAAIIHSAKKIA